MSSLKYVQIKNHNCTVLHNLEPGDAVEFKRGVYSHWAVYNGEGKVVHMTGVDDGGINMNSGSMFTICGKRFNKAKVKIDDFWDVAGGDKAFKNNSKDKKYSPLEVGEILHQARSMVGYISYNVLWQNCEHFASFCRYGIPKSEQADNAIKWMTIGSVVATVLAFVFGGSKNSKSQRDRD